jgi:mono/diheme cytochrome c family protein
MTVRLFGILLFNLVAGCGVPGSSADAGIEASKEMIGLQDFTRRGCPDCHGTNGAGSTTALAGTQVYPANLTPDVDTGIGSWKDDDIVRAIRQGFSLNFVPLCSQMARYDKMSDDEVAAIIAYLRSLAPVRSAIPKSVCPPIKG